MGRGEASVSLTEQMGERQRQAALDRELSLLIQARCAWGIAVMSSIGWALVARDWFVLLLGIAVTTMPMRMRGVWPWLFLMIWPGVLALVSWMIRA